jgi:hypothetical protein
MNTISSVMPIAITAVDAMIQMLLRPDASVATVTPPIASPGVTDLCDAGATVEPGTGVSRVVVGAGIGPD